MKTCKNCGKEFSDEIQFCSECGGRLEEEVKNVEPEVQAHQDQKEQSKSKNGFMGADRTAEFDQADINRNKIYGILASFGILFFIPLVADPQSKYCKFWANQGLIILIVQMIASVVSSVITGILGLFAEIEVIGILFSLLSLLVSIVFAAIPVVFVVFALVYSGTGKAQELPIIGKFSLIK